MWLAGDLGGTSARLGLFRGDTPRPSCVVRAEYRTRDFADLPALVLRFLRDAGVEPRAIDGVCVGVAGPVREATARLTNVPWVVRAAALEQQLGLRRVQLVNDVVAMAYAVPALTSDEVLRLQAGQPDPVGNIALITVGTGFGSCLLHRVGGRLVPSPAETGHSDFAARTDREIDVMRTLRAQFGRVDVERVVSGSGLGHLARAIHGGTCPRMPAGTSEDAVPALVSRQALAGTCATCRETLDLFVEALAAAAGNFALQTLATGGVYLGGGVPVRILEALQQPSFLATFCDKAPMHELMAAIPVCVIREPDAGLIGAAIAAAGG